MVRLATKQDFKAIQSLWDSGQTIWLSPVLQHLLTLHPIEFYRSKTLVFTASIDGELGTYYLVLEDLPEDLQKQQHIHTFAPRPTPV